MALFDPERKRVVIRVVYDGPGFAGKTTNLRRLCKSFASWRRSEMVSPNTLGERTQFFDWLEVDGGLLRSYPIRAQLLTVPGQTDLILRRQFVIERADAVVFVADSQPDPRGVAEAREFYAQLCEQLAGFAQAVPIVFQANKQDVAGALRPRELARRVSEGLRAPDQIKGSVATSDRGVKQTLMVALRLASQNVRDSWQGEDPTAKAGEVGDAETTLRKLEHHERQRERGRPDLGGVQLRPTLPSPELPGDQIWPPTSGRALIGRLYGRPLRTRSLADHPERYTVIVEGDWQLTTGTDRLYDDMDAAAAAMRRLSERKVALGTWLPEPCALATVADPEDRGVWLWTIDPILPSLEARLDDPDPDRRRDALLRFAEVALGAEALAERHGLCVDLDPAVFAVQDGERSFNRYVGHGLEAGDRLDVAGPVLELARRFAADEIALADYVEVLCLGLYGIPAAPERRAALRDAFTSAAAELREPGIRRVAQAATMVLRRAAADHGPSASRPPER